VYLPNDQEREIIWNIQIQKHGRDPKDYDFEQLSRMTEGFTGSEIEQAFIEALYLAFEHGREPSDLDIAQVLNVTVPLSKLMAEQVTALKQWSKGRARSATSQASHRVARKIAA
jgi:SpoVK/Ycf46/Vps4 family AAA+-type ATPase